MKKILRFVRADPAGNVTLLVETPVPMSERSAAARALLERCGGEQAGFIVPPRLGGACRLEMMGGEFCGNALRSLGRWWAAAHPGNGSFLGEISGCDRPLALEVRGDTVRAELPLPLYLRSFEGMSAAVFPGIVHLLREGDPPSEEEIRALTAALCRAFSAPAAGVLSLRGEEMIPAVYVRDTDTLYYERSCASGTAAAAALLSRGREGESLFALRQPGGTLYVRALRQNDALTELSLWGEVFLSPPEEAEIEI